MTDFQQKIICSKCGLDKESSFYGSCKTNTSSGINISVLDTIKVRESLRIRKFSEGISDFLCEFLGGWFPSGDSMLPDGVDKSRSIDRVKDEYHEVVKKYGSDEVIHETCEPLSKHQKNSMGLFSILKGDTLYFNKNAVPVWNEITASLNNIPAGFFDNRSAEKEVLFNALTTAEIAVFDMLFHPNTGIIKNRIKLFDKPAFYVLYEIITLFLISTFKNIRPQEADELKEVFINAVGRTEECNALWNEFDKFYKNNSEQIKIILSRISAYT